MSRLTGMSLTLSAWKERGGSFACKKKKNKQKTCVEHRELFQEAELVAAVTIYGSRQYNTAGTLRAHLLCILIILRYGYHS